MRKVLLVMVWIGVVNLGVHNACDDVVSRFIGAGGAGHPGNGPRCGVANELYLTIMTNQVTYQ